MYLKKFFLILLFSTVLVIPASADSEIHECSEGGYLTCYFNLDPEDVEGRYCVEIFCSEHGRIGASLSLFHFTPPVYSSCRFALFDGAAVSVDGEPLVRLCEHMLAYDFTFCWNDNTHYSYCPICDVRVPGEYVFGFSVPVHTGNDCEFCSYIQEYVPATYKGATVRFLSPQQVLLSSAGRVVDSSFSMVSDTAETVSSQPLLLFGFALGFVGIGVGLYRRLKR